MHKIYIPNSGDLYYFSKKDLKNLPDDEFKESLSNIFELIEKIANILLVPCPHLALSEYINQVNEHDFSLTDMAGFVYYPKDVPGLDKPILHLAHHFSDHLYVTGVIAHEMRHIYHTKYSPELAKNYAQGYFESCYHPAEIDADAFGIWYLANCPDMSYEKAADILCPVEKKFNKEAYDLRIEKAKTLTRELTIFRREHTSFLYKLKTFLGGNKNE